MTNAEVQKRLSEIIYTDHKKSFAIIKRFYTDDQLNMIKNTAKNAGYEINREIDQSISFTKWEAEK